MTERQSSHQEGQGVLPGRGEGAEGQQTWADTGGFLEGVSSGLGLGEKTRGGRSSPAEMGRTATHVPLCMA